MSLLVAMTSWNHQTLAAALYHERACYDMNEPATSHVAAGEHKHRLANPDSYACQSPGPQAISLTSSLNRPCLRRSSSDSDCCSCAERRMGDGDTALLARRTLQHSICRPCNRGMVMGAAAGCLEQCYSPAPACGVYQTWQLAHTFNKASKPSMPLHAPT